jgi:hypothetical protein
VQVDGLAAADDDVADLALEVAEPGNDGVGVGEHRGPF